MTRAVCVWPQAGTVHLSGIGYRPDRVLPVRAAIHEAHTIHDADPVLAAEIATCVTRIWRARKETRHG